MCQQAQTRILRTQGNGCVLLDPPTAYLHVKWLSQLACINDVKAGFKKKIRDGMAQQSETQAMFLDATYFGGIHSIRFKPRHWYDK